MTDTTATGFAGILAFFITFPEQRRRAKFTVLQVQVHDSGQIGFG
jgi:hypothetical protein